MTADASAVRLRDHVDRIAQEHPPIDLDSVDYTVVDAPLVEKRFGPVLDYMARVELEVERNVLELQTLLPDPPEIDRHFYADVWSPQELRHGLILDELQTRLGRPATVIDPDSISAKMHILGGLTHLPGMEPVIRMLYYLTGQATERSAVLAYNRLHDGLADMGEKAIATTIVGQIKRQEPGHHAFYTMSARGLAAGMSTFQLWMVRKMRALSFAPVGVNNDDQKRDFADLLGRLGITGEHEQFVAQIGRVEAELLGDLKRGLPAPPYMVKAFREVVEAAGA